MDGTEEEKVVDAPVEDTDVEEASPASEEAVDEVDEAADVADEAADEEAQ